MLCFAFCSHPPTLTPLQKNARGGGVLSIPSFLPSRASWFFRPFIHSFVPTFVHSFIRTFIRVLPPPLGIWPARADPPRSCLTLPAGLSPAPFPPRPPSRPIAAGWPGGAGTRAGPCSPTTPGSARGSGNAPRGCWAQAGAGGSVAFPATPGLPGPRQRRSTEGCASAATGPG